jgi:hypothetical protein
LLQSYWSDRAQGCVNPVDTPPLLSDVSPAVAPVTGGLKALVTGFRLNYFGTLAGTLTDHTGRVTPITLGCSGGNTCAFIAPPNPQGTYALSLTRNRFTSDNTLSFDYVPVISSISKSSGSPGDAVVITGSGLFYGQTAVNFGPYPGQGVNCAVDGTSCYVGVPLGKGPVVVTATVYPNTGASVETTVSGVPFTYNVPAIATITPASGPITGGTSFAITGTGFDPNAATDGSMQILFEGVPAQGVFCSTNTYCTGTTPAGARGPAHVVATVFGVSSVRPSPVRFTYNPFPKVVTLDLLTSNVPPGYLSLDGYAPTGGATVKLTAVPAGRIQIPTTVTVAGGATDVHFPVTIWPSRTSVLVYVTADYAQSEAYQYIQVTPSPPLTLWFDHTGLAPQLGLGQSLTGTVQLNHRAPAGGVWVTISASDPTGLTFPVRVKIPQHAFSKQFTVTNDSVATPRLVTFTATQGKHVSNDTIEMSPPAIKPPPVCVGLGCS